MAKWWQVLFGADLSESEVILARSPRDGVKRAWRYLGFQEDGEGGGEHFWNDEEGFTHSTSTIVDANVDES